MSDRTKGFVVHLAADIHEDEAARVTAAISMLRGVTQVTPLVADVNHFLAVERARHEIGQSLLGVVFPKRS